MLSGLAGSAREKTMDARGSPKVRAICIDDISPQRRHGQRGRNTVATFVPVISAPKLELVLDVLADRNKESLLKWLDERRNKWCAAV